MCGRYATRRQKQQIAEAFQLGKISMVTGPNQLWCMDLKGYFVTGDGKRCDPFTITMHTAVI
jgi:predicted transposase YbfD/YdcC